MADEVFTIEPKDGRGESPCKQVIASAEHPLGPPGSCPFTVSFLVARVRDPTKIDKTEEEEETKHILLK